MLRREWANKSCMYGYREICLRKLFSGRRTISVMRSLRFFYRYITKKLQAYPKKDVLAVFRLGLFFSQLCIIHSFLKNATTTAPGPTWVPITLPTVV